MAASTSSGCKHSWLPPPVVAASIHGCLHQQWLQAFMAASTSSGCKHSWLPPPVVAASIHGCLHQQWLQAFMAASTSSGCKHSWLPPSAVSAGIHGCLHAPTGRGIRDIYFLSVQGRLLHNSLAWKRLPGCCIIH